jgi:predicted metalloprotease
LEIEGRRRSSKFEDRGNADGGGRIAGGGLPVGLLSALVRQLGFKGTLVVAAVLGVGYLVLPASLRQMLLGGAPSAAQGPAGAKAPGAGACNVSAASAKACDFSRVVLASTEDVWAEVFKEGALPRYQRAPGAYQDPTLVVFTDQVSTGGCGNATSDVGPFYCPRDRKLYVDPTFYDVMKDHLKAPGDFAQAYVIAHEVGHHVQNLVGSSDLRVRGESDNQVSVRVELQADCFAGVWGHTARRSLAIDDADLHEALDAAHAIGDDALGHTNAAKFTHGTSEQRMRWFKRGFDSGDARRCDTFGVERYADL